MKVENREVREFKTVYVAIDGTEFKDPRECEKYEDTCECIINANFKKIAKKIEKVSYKYKEEEIPVSNVMYCFLDEILDRYNETADYYLVQPKTQDDLDIVSKYVSEHNYHSDFFKEGELGERYYACNLNSFTTGKNYIIFDDYDNSECYVVDLDKTKNIINNHFQTLLTGVKWWKDEIVKESKNEQKADN